MNLFRDAHDFRVYRKLWVIAKKRFHLKVYRWTFMTNHIHLLLEQLQAVGIAEAMHFVQGRFARYFGRKYLWKGHVWEDRYSNRIIADERYFRTCAAYIEDNPVKAGLVARAEDYRWSSAAYYALKFRDPLTDQEPYSDVAAPKFIDTDAAKDLFIGRRAVGTSDELRRLSEAIGKDLLVRNRRSSYEKL